MSVRRPEIISATDGTAVSEAVGVLRAGGTVVVPTDTVYGVAAMPTLPGATDALFGLKDRPDRRPLAVLVADESAARRLVESPNAEVSRWMAQLWPGPLTLVLRRASRAAAMALGGDEADIGVRCPDHAFVSELVTEVGPLATTSANRHGQPTPQTAGEAAASLAGPVDLVIDGGRTGTVASTVVDATAPRWRILRHGAISPEALAGLGRPPA